MVGVVGDDPHGALAREVCRKAGIGTAALDTRTGARTGYTDVFVVRSTGRRTFFVNAGANALLDSINASMFFGEPFTLVIRDQFTPEEERFVMGELMKRCDALDGQPS